MIVKYFLAGRLKLTNVEAMPPRKGDELALDGCNYSADRVVLRIEGCPPDYVHVHLKLAEPEVVWPEHHP